jgi:hypothetical protein
VKISKKTAILFVFLSIILHQEKAFAIKVTHAAYPLFKTCGEMQDYFNYRAKNFNEGKMVFFGFENVAMDFRGDEVGRDFGVRYCAGGYFREKNPMGVRTCRGYIRRGPDDSDLQYGHGLYNPFNSYTYSVNEWCRWKN